MFMKCLTIIFANLLGLYWVSMTNLDISIVLALFGLVNGGWILMKFFMTDNKTKDDSEEEG